MTPTDRMDLLLIQLADTNKQLKIARAAAAVGKQYRAQAAERGQKIERLQRILAWQSRKNRKLHHRLSLTLEERAVYDQARQDWYDGRRNLFGKTPEDIEFAIKRVQAQRSLAIHNGEGEPKGAMANPVVLAFYKGAKHGLEYVYENRIIPDFNWVSDDDIRASTQYWAKYFLRKGARLMFLGFLVGMLCTATYLGIRGQ